MGAYLFLIMALLFNAAANLLMKHSAVSTAGGGILRSYLTASFVTGLACFGLNLALYTQALKRLPISVAYPVMVSGGYLIILVVSWFLFQERLTVTRYVGAGLMVAGLWLLVR